MTQNSSHLSWLRRRAPQLLEADHIPLSGGVPPFPWKELSQKLAQAFDLEFFTLSPGEVEWHAAGEWMENLPSPYRSLVFSLSSLEGKIFWVMPEAEVALLLSLCLTHSTDPVDLEEAEYLDGFFRFFSLEILHHLHETSFLPGMTPVMLPYEPFADSSALGLDIACEIEGRSLKGRLLFTPELLNSWRQNRSQLERSARSRRLAEELQVDIHLCVGSVPITLPEWREVQIGDFLVLGNCSLENGFTKGRILLIVENQPVFRARLKDGSLKILEYPILHEEQTMSSHDDPNEEDEEFSDFDEETNEDWDEEEVTEEEEEEEEEGTEEEEEEEEEEEGSEEEEEEEEAPPAPPKAEISPKESASPVRPEDIPMTLVVEVGRLKMSVAQLTALEPGNMLELNVHPESSVDLTIHGKCIGKGELIQIGETLGVRVTDIG